MTSLARQLLEMTDFDDADTLSVIAGIVSDVQHQQPTAVEKLGDNRLECYYCHGSMGGMQWVWLLLRHGDVIGAGRIDDDTDFAGEKGNPHAWVEQAAFIKPGYQRQGLYTAVLRFFMGKLGHIYPDISQSTPNAALWYKHFPHALSPKPQ